MPYVRWLVLSIALCLILAACGDDAPQSASTLPTSTSASTPQGVTSIVEPTTEPTVAPQPPTATATGVPSVGPQQVEPTATFTLTVEPTASATVEPSPTATEEPASPIVGDVNLDQYLLTLSDMPLGWTIWLDEDDDSEGTGPVLCNAESISSVVPNLGSAETQFQQGSLGPFLIQMLAQFENTDRADEAMDYVESALTCSEWITINDDGTETTVTLTPLAFPKVADRTYVFRMTVPVGFVGSLEVDVLFVQSGRFVTTLMHMGVNTVDSNQTLAFIETAIGKLPLQ